MAKQSVPDKPEEWIRQVALPKLYGQKFSQKSLLLKSGGQYKYDTVSEDAGIVAVNPVVKEQRIRRSEIKFLLHDQRIPRNSIRVG